MHSGKFCFFYHGVCSQRQRYILHTIQWILFLNNRHYYSHTYTHTSTYRTIKPKTYTFHHIPLCQGFTTFLLTKNCGFASHVYSHLHRHFNGIFQGNLGMVSQLFPWFSISSHPYPEQPMLIGSHRSDDGTGQNYHTHMFTWSYIPPTHTNCHPRGFWSSKQLIFTEKTPFLSPHQQHHKFIHKTA